MNHPILLMLHVLFGVLCLIGSLWVFVDTLGARADNLSRIRAVSVLVAATMWIAYLIAGYWYIDFYGPDKALILKGPWPWAHDLCMETKEHLVIMLLLLATYLPIAARGHLDSSPAARSVVLWTSGLACALALIADSFGAIIAMGVKVALLVR
jgi:predicted membrane channel-forming protein YqfA (hemolysin III family)